MAVANTDKKETKQNTNPLLESSTLKHGAVPFDRIRNDHFLPALEQAIGEGRTRIEAMKAVSAPADFENTLLPLETGPEKVQFVAGIFFNLLSAESGEELQALAKEMSPRLAAFSSDILLDEKIFARIKELHERRESLQLTGEQKRLIEKTYKDFARNGALLSPEKKEQLRALDQEMAKLGPEFSENVLKATNAYQLVITDKQDLSGLPESTVEMAAQTAEALGKSGAWAITLQAPSYIPFMMYADNRALREKIWRAYNSRAFGSEFDNSKVLKRIVELRHERAQLLGYQSHAQFVLEERMAEKPEKVTSFLERLLKVSRQAAEKDVEAVRALKKELTGDAEVQPWDWSYYSDKLKKRDYDLDQEKLRPYFKLESVISGVFEHARRLYGLEFRQIEGIPTYHPDVKTYEVVQEGSGEFVGLFYADFFPRKTKRGGAWMTTFRDQGMYEGRLQRPHVSIVCNFTQPSQSQPSLLTYEEVQTLFHEFGHGLHALLSECTYTSVSGTSVYWDFVELPSQIMENWVQEKEGLDVFAKHYQTGEPMPVELTDKLKKAANFQAGYMSLRQLNFGMLDMAWHTRDPKSITDIDGFEQDVTAQSSILPRVDGTNVSASFSHVFAGGYSAGYYSYKWAEVLEADAFELFKEKGLFNREVAKSFRDNILSRGGTEHPMELFKRFRGREPDPEALLRREGLI